MVSGCDIRMRLQRAKRPLPTGVNNSSCIVDYVPLINPTAWSVLKSSQLLRTYLWTLSLPLYEWTNVHKITVTDFPWHAFISDSRIDLMQIYLIWQEQHEDVLTDLLPTFSITHSYSQVRWLTEQWFQRIPQERNTIYGILSSCFGIYPVTIFFRLTTILCVEISRLCLSKAYVITGKIWHTQYRPCIHLTNTYACLFKLFLIVSYLYIDNCWVFSTKWPYDVAILTALLAFFHVYSGIWSVVSINSLACLLSCAPHSPKTA